MLKRKFLFLLFIFIFIVHLYGLENSCSPNITITNIEKLNSIYEVSIPATQNISSENTPLDRSAGLNITSENSLIDLNIQTDLLYTDLPKIYLYNKPEPTGNIIGWITPPGRISVIKIQNNYAKVKVNSAQAGWILKRNISNNFKPTEVTP